ncbi:GMC family oxidoreductase [Streptomyces althioticus]|uniref:GMC family oxidoreductase n=1 Tax=Streptomyces althioticus TaxID=83380 RepID=UPI0036A59DD6
MQATRARYDFIVVGGGTAGSVIAARLSEDENTSVLLLEAGAAGTPPVGAVPPAWPALLETPANWGDTTVVQAATGTSVLLARGRVLGGGSAINAMAFVRGHRSSYDAWPEAGAEGWGFDDLLPYFKRSENTAGRDPRLRGVGGPLTVGPASPPNPVVAALLEGAEQAGHRRAADISGGAEEGFGWSDLNVVDGRRQNAADAYLRPVLHRPNLTVTTDALVHRLHLSNGRCTGVEYSTGDSHSTVLADSSTEVVLTAGAIGSAQLLMLSGIGPQAHLSELGIDVTLDLPGVGTGLHDHPIGYVIHHSAQPVPAGANNHGEAHGLLRTDAAADGPDLQMFFVDIPIPIPSAEVPEMGHGYAIGVSPMRPHSRGTVRLASAEPGALPRVDPNYFGDDRDLATMVHGLRMAREVGRTPALAAWRGKEAQPTSQISSDDELRAYARRTVTSYMHPVGTCRLGDDAMAVVDGELRVHGIAGLRIADASVFPSIPSANTNATVCAVAERAADMIKG